MGDKWTTSGRSRLRAIQKHGRAPRISNAMSGAIVAPAVQSNDKLNNSESHPRLRKRQSGFTGTYSAYADPIARRGVWVSMGPSPGEYNPNHPPVVLQQVYNSRRIRDASRNKPIFSNGSHFPQKHLIHEEHRLPAGMLQSSQAPPIIQGNYARNGGMSYIDQPILVMGAGSDQGNLRENALYNNQNSTQLSMLAEAAFPGLSSSCYPLPSHQYTNHVPEQLHGQTELTSKSIFYRPPTFSSVINKPQNTFQCSRIDPTILEYPPHYNPFPAVAHTSLDFTDFVARTEIATKSPVFNASSLSFRNTENGIENASVFSSLKSVASSAHSNSVNGRIVTHYSESLGSRLSDSIRKERVTFSPSVTSNNSFEAAWGRSLYERTPTGKRQSFEYAFKVDSTPTSILGATHSFKGDKGIRQFQQQSKYRRSNELTENIENSNFISNTIHHPNEDGANKSSESPHVYAFNVDSIHTSFFTDINGFQGEKGIAKFQQQTKQRNNDYLTDFIANPNLSSKRMRLTHQSDANRGSESTYLNFDNDYTTTSREIPKNILGTGAVTSFREKQVGHLQFYTDSSMGIDDGVVPETTANEFLNDFLPQNAISPFGNGTVNTSNLMQNGISRFQKQAKTAKSNKTNDNTLAGTRNRDFADVRVFDCSREERNNDDDAFIYQGFDVNNKFAEAVPKDSFSFDPEHFYHNESNQHFGDEAMKQQYPKSPSKQHSANSIQWMNYAKSERYSETNGSRTEIQVLLKENGEYDQALMSGTSIRKKNSVQFESNSIDFNEESRHSERSLIRFFNNGIEVDIDNRPLSSPKSIFGLNEKGKQEHTLVGEDCQKPTKQNAPTQKSNFELSQRSNAPLDSDDDLDLRGITSLWDDDKK